MKFNIYECSYCRATDPRYNDLLEIKGQLIVICFKCESKAKGKPKVNFYPELVKDEVKDSQKEFSDQIEFED